MLGSGLTDRPEQLGVPSVFETALPRLSSECGHCRNLSAAGLSLEY